MLQFYQADFIRRFSMNRRSSLSYLVACVKVGLLLPLARGAETTAETIRRTAGPRWNVNGHWNPTVEVIQQHLLHSHGIDPRGYSLDEMLALHDNDHNRRGHVPKKKKKPKSSARGYRPV
jgi:hypothetical protein